MVDYTVETVLTALVGGVGILWHQLIRQISINRTDQKQFSEALKSAVAVIAENNEIIRDMKDFIKHEREK